MNSDDYAIIILAAGSSSRYGSPKQLLLYKSKSLLIHSVDAALETGCQSVYVVLGSNFDLISKELKNKPVIILENAGWKEGIASSIRCGMTAVTNSTQIPGHVILMVCDQPFVSSSLLLKLAIKKQETGKPIVACNYNESYGIPVLFHQVLFPELLKLKGDKGAQKIIRQNPDKTAFVPFPEGIIEIDSVSDYEFLRSKMNNN